MTHMLTGLACLTVALLFLAAAAVDWALGTCEQLADDTRAVALLRIDSVLTCGVTGRQWEEFVTHHPLCERSHRTGDAP